MSRLHKRSLFKLAPPNATGLLLFLLLTLTAFVPLAISEYGLDNPTPVGDFMDNNFPPRTPGVGSGAWQVELAFPSHTFESPMFLMEEPGSGRILIAEKTGRIQAFQKSPVGSKSVYLDLSSRTWTDGESGVLSFAFHPRYNIDSNYVYVFYQYEDGSNDYSRISRFTVSPNGSGDMEADGNSEMVLIQQLDRNLYHNGGGFFFGQDGFLYISTGDEGGSNNSYDNSQYLDKRLFGGILRIDVDRNPSTSHAIRRQPSLHSGIGDNSFTANYFIPNDNPWQDVNGGYLEEFYALGLRNPYGVSQDPVSGRIFLADVGQQTTEEVNVLSAGANYYWPIKEGSAWYFGTSGTPIGNEALPIFEYQHNGSGGSCIIGGYVYRGSEHPDLYGKYIFGDNGSKRLWALTYDAGGNHTVELLMTLPFSSQFYSLSGFGVDGDGELYIMKFNGNNSSGGEIYKLTRQNQGAVEPPTLLSQTGAFSNLNNMQPEDYLIPFELNMPFYSDAAKKYRWFTVPNNGNYASDGTQIDNSANGDWDYPNGSVLVKHFEIQTDENDATSKRKLETRFMIKGDDGKFYGVTYRWNDAQTDATLLTDSRTDTFAIQTSTGPQTLTWYYPSRGECLSCHNEVTGGVLGPKASQLNSDAFYEISGRTANQLKTYMYIDLLENPIDTNNLAGLLTSAPPNSTDFTLEEEVMSYLDANCASCHRPGTGVQADFDAQLSTPLDQKDIVYGAARKDMGKPGSQIVVPGDLEHSVLYQRMKLVHSELAMPPVGKNNVDEYGLTLMENWIMSLDPDFATQGCNNQVNPADMSIHYVDSEETNGENAPASNAIDGDANTYWHTEWQNSSPPPPHDLQINLGAVRSVNQISYLPRAGGANGTIRDYEIYLSMDGSSWGSPVASGTWGGGASERFVSFAAQNASYVRLLALSEINGNNWTSVAEFRVYEGGCNKKGQSIQFADIDHQPASVANISLTATATSTLPVNFEVVSGPATLGANNLLDFTGSEGLVVIRATQDGDSDYNAAEPVERSFRIIPNGSGNGTGLRGEYYNNDDLSDLRFARTDAQIDFYWGAGAPDAGMSGDTYSVLWKGKIESPVSDTVHFVTRTDDGVRLWVNNQLLIDAWQDQSATQHSGKLFMNAGAQVPIRVEFYEKGVYAEASLSWFSNDIPQEIVPQAFLYPDVVFPAELLEFNAVVEDGQVLLDWKTAQEENVSHFTVERSEDGSVFSDLLDVAAVGSSRVVQSYNATDIAPMPGTSYYRLRTIDFDGAFDFSPTVEVTIEDQNLFLQLEAFPNPVGQRGELTVRLKSNEDRSLRVRMVSTTGQTVQELTHQMNGTESQLRLSRKGLSEGIYFLVVEDEAFRKVQRIWLR